MRVATWNVGYGISPTRNERIRHQMEVVDADVWVLTETHDMVVPPGRYQAVSTIQRPGTSQGIRDGSRWVSVWSRLPAEQVCTVDSERSAAALVTVDGTRVLIFGTVLPWTTDTERPGMVHELSRQMPDWRDLPSHLGASAIVAGDFNVNLGGPHYYGANASKAAVARALAEAGLVVMTDYDHLLPLAPTEGVIDHIAVSAGLAANSRPAAVWGRQNEHGEPMSDHSGVAVDIDLPS